MIHTDAEIWPKPAQFVRPVVQHAGRSHYEGAALQDTERLQGFAQPPSVRGTSDAPSCQARRTAAALILGAWEWPDGPGLAVSNHTLKVLTSSCSRGSSGGVSPNVLWPSPRISPCHVLSLAAKRTA